MSKLDIRYQIRIQPQKDYWFTVEDIHLDVGCDGLTISYWEIRDGAEKRINKICIDKDAAIAVANAIHMLFKEEEA